MSTRYTLRKYPFAYLADGRPVRLERATREMRPFFADQELTSRLVLRRRGRSHYFARPPRRLPETPGASEESTELKESKHGRLIRQLQETLEAGASVRVRAFDGLRLHPVVQLLPPAAPGARRCVRERSLLGFPGVRPDLQLCRASDSLLLLVIEVCDTNPVGESKAAIYRRLGVPCIEVRAVQGIDADGVLNAETMWGPGAPLTVVQALLEHQMLPGPVSRSSGQAHRQRSWTRCPAKASAAGRPRPRASQFALTQGLHPIIRMFLQSIGIRES